MNPKLGYEATYQQISQFYLLVERQFPGTNILRYNTVFLNKSIQRRMDEIHCATPGQYLKTIAQNPSETKLLTDSLLNNYTEFFRNPLTFSVLERIVLPSLILKNKASKNKEIRIWSAACATGQESYSLAMLLEELMNGEKATLNYRIFATDQSEAQVNKARIGLFSADEINNLTMKRVSKWFTNQGNAYFIKQELKNNIDFSVFDLFDERFSSPPASIYGDFNIVVCANLLFYYKPEFREILLEKTGNCLARGGFLICGETEREILLDSHYQEVFPQSAIFRKK